MNPDRQKQLDYVERVMQRYDLNQSELANRSGLDTSTLSRFVTGAAEGRLLSTRSLRRIESFSGVLYNPNKIADPATQKLDGATIADVDATRYLISDKQPSLLDNAVRSMIGQANHLDAWLLRSRAIESVGYVPSDILIVDTTACPRAGDAVCAQVYDLQVGGPETIFRIFQPPCLVAATTDARLLRPYIIDTANVSVKGVVVASLHDARTHQHT